MYKNIKKSIVPFNQIWLYFDGEYEQLYVVQGDATGIKATPFKPNASPVSIKPDTGKK